MHDQNCFITLTYNPESLPIGIGGQPTLNMKHFPVFIRKLRDSTGKKIRYFMCGEYGDEYHRPHYHACLFGHEFEDQEIWKIQNGQNVYTSSMLSKMWPYGFSTVGTVTWKSAGYCARYIMKKLNKRAAGNTYQDIDQESGEIRHLIEPEYTRQSNRPGLGYSWFEQYSESAYPHDYIIIDGNKKTVPRYYDKLLDRTDPELLLSLKEKRRLRAEENPEEQTSARLAVREKVQAAKITKLHRPFEAPYDPPNVRNT